MRKLRGTIRKIVLFLSKICCTAGRSKEFVWFADALIATVLSKVLRSKYASYIKWHVSSISGFKNK